MGRRLYLLQVSPCQPLRLFPLTRFRYPVTHSTLGPWTYSYDESRIFDIGTALGWPWSLPKHSPFAFEFVYIGFLWSLEQKTVSLPAAKCAAYASKLASWLATNYTSQHDCESIVGTLNHCTLAVRDGRSHLPSFYKMLGAFRSPSPFIRHKITPSVRAETLWWLHRFRNTWCGIKIKEPPPPLPTALFVDASTSWGIGLTLDNKWLAWELKPGWKSDDRDIGWAEMVAVELALRTLVAAGFRDCHIILRSDNKGVIGALKQDMSRNSSQNKIVRHILNLFFDYDIWLTIEYVPSADNPADPPSRGPLHRLFPPRSRLLPFPPKIPHHLEPFVHHSVPYSSLRK